MTYLTIPQENKGLRIVLIGDFTGTPDEGMKNVSATLGRLMAKNHAVVFMNPAQALSAANLLRLREFDPHVIHYLHGPTVRSLVLLKMLGFLTSAKTVVSATRPHLTGWAKTRFHRIKPHLTLTQSHAFETFARSRGAEVAFFPNGVDTDKFSPADPGKKAELRKALGLPLDQKIILHVGHIKPNRQLDVFFQIQQIPGIQVVVAGGTHEAADLALKERLIKAGIRVVHEYLPDISILYKAADLYVFPIVDQGRRETAGYNSLGAIDLPMSVLEAMGCNLPVLSTPFGALPRVFNEGDGLVWARDADEIVARVWNLPKGESHTRRKVLPLAWPVMVSRLEALYQNLIRTRPSRATLLPWTSGRVQDEI